MTECKTDKTVIQKIEWSNERGQTFNRPINLNMHLLQQL
jgi:hypothetical protein